jgi:hypothetical protein
MDDPLTPKQWNELIRQARQRLRATRARDHEVEQRLRIVVERVERARYQLETFPAPRVLESAEGEDDPGTVGGQET